jgi:glyoxylase-like metal-dependent hydrolase (beta-lactamase superfamily II)
MRSLTLLLVLTLSISAHAESTTNPETLTERSQARAREVLDRAVTALGGAALLKSISAVRYQHEGESWERLQMATPLPPYEATRQQHAALLDLDDNRVRIDMRTRSTGADIHASVVVIAGSGTYYNHRTRSAAPMVASVANQYSTPFHRRLPQLLLRQALDNASTLRHLGRDDGGGKPQEVIAFVTPRGEQVSVYVDATSHLVSKGEVLYVDPLTGDEASEFAFADYARSGKHLIPRALTEREAGETIGKFTVQAEFDPALTAASFEVPREGYVDVEAQQPLKDEVQRLANGVFVMRNIAGSNQHSLAVAFTDYVLVVEAPGSSEGADKLIARIKETIPGKPIRYVAITHHHGDHIGGLRSFIAEGATVITTPGNREYIEAVARAPQFDRLREQPRKPQFQLINGGKHVLSDAANEVQLIDIGPNPHAREIVVAYLPRERVLFQADVFVMPYTKRPLHPAFEQTASFAKRIRELGLKVDHIVGVHGRSGTASEFSEMTKLEL